MHMSCSTICQAVTTYMNIPNNTCRSPYVVPKHGTLSNTQKFDGVLVHKFMHITCSTNCQAVASCINIPNSISRSLKKPGILSNRRKFDGTLVFRSHVSYNPVNGFSCRCATTSVNNGEDVFSVVTSSTTSEVDYLGESTKGDLNLNFGIDGQALQGPVEEVAKMEAQEAENLLQHLGILVPYNARHSPRGIFCSRTLNLRSISAIGYDMDYTLMHYNGTNTIRQCWQCLSMYLFSVTYPFVLVPDEVFTSFSVRGLNSDDKKRLWLEAWEGRAYDYCMENLRNVGFPVDGLAFDPELVIRGLVIDKEKGNLVKADRFGYIKRAMHGTRMLSTREVSEIYGRELVDLRKESRWEFLNTLFSVSEAVAYMQMVDRLDEGIIGPDLCPFEYKGLYKAVGKALFRAHVEGQLKSEIMSKPELFVEPDPELPLALLDQKEAGKRLLLITNSDYHYTDKMMQHSFNRYLPNDMSWRDLFEMVIVSARKPEFFQMSHPMYEVVTGEGLMRPCFKARPAANNFLIGGVYSGGSAQMVESSLNVHGDEILYVGDHIYTDVSQSKVHLRWRTALICRELEEEVSNLHQISGIGSHLFICFLLAQLVGFGGSIQSKPLEFSVFLGFGHDLYNALIDSQQQRATLIDLINQKEVLGDLFNQLRLALQRRTLGRPAQLQWLDEPTGDHKSLERVDLLFSSSGKPLKGKMDVCKLNCDVAVSVKQSVRSQAVCVRISLKVLSLSLWIALTLAATHMDDNELTESMQKLLVVMQRLDQKIGPMLDEDGDLFNKRWGYLSRAGLWDKSHLMRQIEKYADIYTSRVSNFLHYTPFMYFRAQEQNLAHDSYTFDHLRRDN
ncbi:hypothetical protein RND71_027132 [Anisodus tanguticus]|uniref:Cytosolic purine 5'-nucleotidase n=1 Tax=Anisodus tanguticus TaxID=243964 RepID=A0AAE1V3F7_9SOLA|nr:hypothetical protein RND71_027132 [Anisodus tanguticus]